MLNSYDAYLQKLVYFYLKDVKELNNTLRG